MRALGYVNFDIKTRGVNLRNILDAVRYKRGTEGLNRIKTILEKECKINTNQLVEKEWYPLWYEFALLECACTLDTKPDSREVLENAAYIGLRGAEDIGILKFFVKFTMTPNELAEKSKNDWRHFYTGGEFVVHKNTPGEIICEISGFPYFEIYEHNILGFLKGVLRLTGVKNGNVEIIGRYKYRCTW